MNQRSTFSKSSSWRDLDVAQIASWPDAPRRFVVGLGALLLTGILAYFVLLPVYTQWEVAQQQTIGLQQQYRQLSQTAAHRSQISGNQSIPSVKTVSAAELSNWLSEFASMTQAHGFAALSIKPLYPSKDKPSGEAKSVAADMIHDGRVGQLNVSGEGEYAQVLKWIAMLSEREEILGVDEFGLQGSASDQVRWQARVFFAMEPER